jgi:hypothetical protein
MRIARRAFIRGAGLFVAAPVLASLPPSAADGWPLAVPSSAPLPPQSLDEPADGADVVFKIDGWSVRDPASIGRTALACDEVWISINRSWRTAWR